MENRKGEIEVKMDFDISDVSNKLLMHLKKITNNLTHIYYAIEKNDTNYNKLLPTDNLPFLINDNKTKPTIEEQKRLSLNWILTKSFEEIINGLIISFREAYKYLKIFDLSQRIEKIWTVDEFNKEIKIIDKNIASFHFPTFIKEIEKLLNQPLPFKNEILSFNKIRNCFVHREGIVGENDINSLSNDLSLKWVSLDLFTIKQGKEIKVNYQLRKKGITVNNLLLKTIKREKKFNVGDYISVDIDVFNEISSTCSVFAVKLFEMMPRLE